MAEVGGVVGRDAARVHGDDRPGLERHHLPPGRVVEPHRSDHRPIRQRRVRLVPDVDGDTDGGERLDGRGLAQAARRRAAAARASARPAPRSPPSPPRWSEHTSTSASNPDSRSSISEAGRWWKAAATRLSGSGGLDGGGHRAPGRDQGQHLAALLDQGVGHRDDDLAGQRLAQRPDGGDGAVPRRGHDHQVGRGGAGVVRRPSSARSESGQRADDARRPPRRPAPRRANRS